MGREEFERLLGRLRSSHAELTWRAWHWSAAPETTDVVFELGWIDGYVILTPYADVLWVDVNGATFEDLDGADAPEFFEALFAGRFRKVDDVDGSLAELTVFGDRATTWSSG